MTSFLWIPVYPSNIHEIHVFMEKPLEEPEVTRPCLDREWRKTCDLADLFEGGWIQWKLLHLGGDQTCAMEKRAPGCLGSLVDGNPTQLYGDYFISHEVRIPFLKNQDFMECQKGFERCSPQKKGTYAPTCQLYLLSRVSKYTKNLTNWYPWDSHIGRYIFQGAIFWESKFIEISRCRHHLTAFGLDM